MYRRETRSRITLGKLAFSRVKNILVTMGIDVKLQKRFTNCVI